MDAGIDVPVIDVTDEDVTITSEDPTETFDDGAELVEDVECEAGLTRCGAQCVDTQGNIDHCGSCNQVCSAGDSTGTRVYYCLPNDASVVCAASCAAGRQDCDGNPINGCEVDVTSSLAHCGACGAGCRTPPTGAIAACSSSACDYRCLPGRGDCDGDLGASTPGNGCEVDVLGSTAHCGRCGNACSVANGTPQCRAGACEIARCNTNFADCDRAVANGCEVNLQSDAANCGACGTTCTAGQVCTAGRCASACPTGQTMCGSSCAALATDVANCGACGTRCGGANTTSPATCMGGACAPLVCATNFANCDGLASTGCEASLQTDSAHCGACGNRCAAGQECVRGACTTQCNAPNLRCATVCANPNEDNANCGRCGDRCERIAALNSVRSCRVGTCLERSDRLALGDRWSCYLRGDGAARQVLCWGRYPGRTTTDYYNAEIYHGLDGRGTVVAISGHYQHLCAIVEGASDGGLTRRVYCWGSNAFGELGPAPGSDAGVSPFLVPLTDNALQVSANANVSCAVVAPSTGPRRVLCWGRNNFRQLGVGSSDSAAHPTPAAIIAPTGLTETFDPIQVSIGPQSGCAVTSIGRLVCWGSNLNGLIARPTVGGGAFEPTSVPGITEPVGDGGTQPAVFNTVELGGPTGTGDATTEPTIACAVTLSGIIRRVRCWGGNRFNQAAGEVVIPDGGPPDVVPTPTAVQPIEGPHRLVQAAPGSDFACALRDNSLAYCWGNPDRGATAHSPPSNIFNGVPAPTTLVSVGDRLNWTMLAAGTRHTCATYTLESAPGVESVACWGQNTDGQLGNGNTVDSVIPVRVVLPPTP